LHIRHVHAKLRSVAREAEGGVLSDASILQLAQRVVASGTSPSTNLFRKELRNTVRGALNQLKADDREVLILRYLEQLDAGEIAAILGISGEAASMRHLRALRRLRELLKDSLGGI
jgi:RNA polymerase sigma-70 factor (ECF subfamily)